MSSEAITRNDLTAILNEVLPPNDMETDSVTTSSSLSFSLCKRGEVASVSCTAGTVTASANTSFATIPSGFRPYIKQEVMASTGQRVVIGTDGSITCPTALSSAGIRFSSTYVIA